MTIPTGSGAVGDHSYYTVAFNKSSSWTNKARGPWSQVSSDQPGGLLFHSYNPTVDSGYDLYPQDGFEFSIDLSFCSPGFDGRVKSVEIEARRPRASDEPASLSAGVQQLGATRNTMTDEERGVLTLNSTSLFRQARHHPPGEAGRPGFSDFCHLRLRLRPQRKQDPTAGYALLV
jgi:hypothetical protein